MHAYIYIYINIVPSVTRIQRVCTFELVRLFVSDQANAADAEVLEYVVDVPLHRLEGKVAHVGRERRVRRQILLTGGPAGRVPARSGHINTR